MSTFRTQAHSIALDTKILQFLSGIPNAPARALMLDYDGTIAPFSSNLAQALPYPELSPLLAHLHERSGTRIVIVSERPAIRVSQLLHIPGIEIWGSHGLEHLGKDGALTRIEIPSEPLEAINRASELLNKDGLGDFVERGFASIAVHWRGNESMAGVLTRRFLRAWSTIQHFKGVRLISFDGGIEIAASARNKGHAVQTVLNEIGPNAAVAYLGDDSSDEDAFAALHGLGLNILVRKERRRTLADACIQPPGQVVDFLTAWISTCNRSA